MKLATRMSRLGTETAFEVLAKAKRLEAEGRDIIHLQIGEPDFDTPMNIVDAGVKALKGGYTHYGPSAGLPPLRAKIAEEVSKTRGVQYGPENVVVTPGGKPIMFFAILALVNEGDEVLYPNPGFPIYESMIRFVGGVPVPMKLTAAREFAIDVDEVAKSITPKTKLMVINSPNNPCGSIVPKETLEKLAKLSVKHDIPVLSDEIYIRFLFEGKHDSIVSFPGMKERTIILDGFSKTYAMTGWRIGYGVMPKEMVDPIAKLMTNSVSCTSSATQMAALEALNGSQDAANAIVAEFKARRDIFVGGLNKISGIKCPMPEGAFYAFPNIEGTGMTSRQFADGLLDEFGVACLAGESFGEFGKGCVRFSFANSTKNLERALERIDKFVKSKKK
ncbi:MAG: pyridoxal phosphate-dependent aminotransferase [SAR202 cluster bacterium]|nr:pyridoxal phosphate-dependent aminotransferase [SAR202 cluster bacterium]